MVLRVLMTERGLMQFLLQVSRQHAHNDRGKVHTQQSDSQNLIPVLHALVSCCSMPHHIASFNLSEAAISSLACLHPDVRDHRPGANGAIEI